MTFQRYGRIGAGAPLTPGRLWAALGALHGGAAVVADAFGAHGAPSAHAADLFHTGARWEVVAALAAILAARAGATTAAALQVLGAAAFAGALYGLALGGPSGLGALAPVGGGLMILGWLAFAWRLARG